MLLWPFIGFMKKKVNDKKSQKYVNTENSSKLQNGTSKITKSATILETTPDIQINLKSNLSIITGSGKITNFTKKRKFETLASTNYEAQKKKLKYSIPLTKSTSENYRNIHCDTTNVNNSLLSTETSDTRIVSSSNISS